MLVTGPLIQGISSIGCGLAVNYGMLLWFRFLQGIGSAMYTTAAIVMLADISTPANRGRLMSYYQGRLLLGSGLGPTMGGFIAQYFGLAAPFFVYAVLVFLASLWAYLRLPETRPAMSDPGATPAAGHSPHASPNAVTSLLTNRNFVLISAVTFGIFFMRQGALNEILPLLGTHRLGLREGQIGLALTLVALFQFFTVFPSGRLADHFGRKAVITPGCLIAALSLILIAQSENYGFLLFSCVIMGVGIGLSGSTPSAYVADIVPRESYGTAMGTYRAISDLGFVIGPVFLGWLADIDGLRSALWFNGLFLVLIILIFQLCAKEPHKPHA